MGDEILLGNLHLGVAQADFLGLARRGLRVFLAHDAEVDVPDESSPGPIGVTKVKWAVAGLSDDVVEDGLDAWIGGDFGVGEEFYGGHVRNLWDDCFCLPS